MDSGVRATPTSGAQLIAPPAPSTRESFGVMEMHRPWVQTVGDQLPRMSVVPGRRSAQPTLMVGGFGQLTCASSGMSPEAVTLDLFGVDEFAVVCLSLPRTVYEVPPAALFREAR